MLECAVALALLFSLACGVFSISHSNHVGRITFLDWAILALGGLYGIGWSFVIVVTQSGGNPIWENWLVPFVPLFTLHTVSAFVLAASIVLGWYASGRILPHRLYCQFSGRDRRAVPWARSFWSVLLIAVGVQWVYVQAYGGFLAALDFSALIRSAIFEVDNPFSFLKPFAGLSFVATLGFFGLWLSGRRKFSTALGMVLSFIFSVYVFYSWLGRMGFLVFLVAFPLGAAIYRGGQPLKFIILGAVGFIAILVAAYGVSIWLNIKAANSFLEFVAREISFPFGSFFAQLTESENLFRMFMDFFVAPIFLLPSSWWHSWFEPVGQVNTALILGAPKGEAGVTGGIPVDLITLGLMQVHLIGVPFVGLLYGALIRVLQALVDRIPLAGVRASFEAYIALKIAVLGIFYSQPNLVIAGNFPFLLGAILIMFTLVLDRVRIWPRKGRNNGGGEFNS